MQMSLPTIQIVVLANFAALAAVWFYVVRSYPALHAARFWQVSMIFAATGTAVSLLRGAVHPMLPVVIGNGLMLLACGSAWAGVRQFYGRSVPITAVAIIAAIELPLLVIFTGLYDDINVRIVVISIADSIPLALAVRDLRGRPDQTASPGADLAGLMCGATVAMHVVRAIAVLSGIGGEVSLLNFNALQGAVFLLLMFAGMMANFGFVLMAIDRLRNDVAALALIDDLTGIANRRHFLVRLAEACARATRLNEPFALLAIDLDGFKAINDSHGHAAGDECLLAFTRAAQARLRTGDLLARSGGDEFCVILPATTLSEAALVARSLIQGCRKTRVPWKGIQIPITASIGIAEWSRATACDSQQLIAEADQALYVAKKQGRDRLAVYENVIPRLRKTA
jgi:diguanylate cyclase (GGDEF)-like protein